MERSTLTAGTSADPGSSNHPATLTSRPTETVRLDMSKLSLQDALDLAILIEEEARLRYEEFVNTVGAARYPGDAADMFRMMRDNEVKHRDELTARRTQMFGDAPRRVSLELLDDVEAPDRGKPRVFMGPRQAMEIALESEEKAYEFYSEAARWAKDAQVKALFEEMAREEQQHQSLVAKLLQKLPPGPDVEDDEADEPGTDPGN